MNPVQLAGLLFFIEDVAEPQRLIVTTLDGELLGSTPVADANVRVEALWALCRAAAIGEDGF